MSPLISTLLATLLLPVHPALQQTEGVELFEMRSELLTAFWGRPMQVEAGVVLPPDHDPSKKNTPVCYSIHGFGGSHRSALRTGERLRKAMMAPPGTDAAMPRMIYVFLNAQFPLGHHELADSVNNGPFGKALIEELIPALEQRFGAAGSPEGRFLTGHSSGGWSSLWLQITYPDFFNGTWSTAPDSVDFRDFTGIDIYSFESAYVDPSGEDIPLIRQKGEWVMTIREFVTKELEKSDYGGQFASFDAVFSPRAEDGRPMRMFDRETGKIDREVARAWEKYDIRLVLKRNWEHLGPKLKGKLHVYMGDQDTFRLEGATKLLKQELESLGSDAEVLIVEGRDHGSLFAPHPTHWPKGMLEHIHHEMWKRWEITKPVHSGR